MIKTNQTTEQTITTRRARLNAPHEPALISAVLNKAAAILEKRGWCPHIGTVGSVDVLQAMHIAIQHTGPRDGLWFTCRRVLMRNLGLSYSLASWNDKQDNQEDVVRRLRIAASAVLTPVA